MSDLTEQVIAELCAYLGNDTSTTTEAADKLIALITEACIKSVSRLYLLEDDDYTHVLYNDVAINEAIRAIRALSEVKE